MAKEITYCPSPTGAMFHRDDSSVRALMGPFGSGKSVTCVVELLMRAYKQMPDKNGIRRSRWVIIRNTYRQLLDTTMETFFEWVPKAAGEYQAGNMKFIMRQKLDDGTKLEAEFIFRALDKPEDVKKLLSLEVTGAFLNEVREIPRVIADAVTGRLRFPKTIKKDGKKIYGATWRGVIMDTNPPDSDHWFYKVFEEEKPEGYKLYKQPSGVSEKAENLDNLEDTYYTDMMRGKTKQWIDVYVHGTYGFVSDGSPVYPEYNDDLHYSNDIVQLNKQWKLFVGIDFGLTPAAVIGVQLPSGQIIVIDELVTFNMGATSFGKLLHAKLSSHKYQGFSSIEIYADPAGEQRAQTDEETPFMILAENKIDAYPTFTNDFTIRRETVANCLTELDFTGKPLLLIGPGAPSFRKAMGGGYKYKRLRVANEDRFKDMPDKNQYSHVAEAGQYLFLGAYGSSASIGGFNSKKPIDYSKQAVGYR
jgi:hypothetical protein